MIVITLKRKKEKNERLYPKEYTNMWILKFTGFIKEITNKQRLQRSFKNPSRVGSGGSLC